MSPGAVALVALASGVAGYAIENAFAGPRASRAVPSGFPFMPVYAAGGAAVALLAPKIRDEPPLVRALAYGAVLTAIEGTAGAVDRATGGRSWDYDGSVVDLPHAALWAGAGLALEQVLLGFQS